MRKSLIFLPCFFAFQYLSGQTSGCAITEAEIDSLNRAFLNVTEDGKQTMVEYDSLKSTFIFTSLKNAVLLKTYKLIVTDIHPEGVFPIEQGGKVYIKIISRCAGNVFIETYHGNGILRSGSTGKIIIGGYSLYNRKQVDLICSIIGSIVAGCASSKVPDKRGRIPLPVTKN